MARENSGWGYAQILANLGHHVFDQTVGNILRQHGIARLRREITTWKNFLAAHMSVLVGCELGEGW